VRAIVSLPSYDNNLFVLHFSDSELEEILQCPDKPLFNRAVSGSYPPGSSIKPYIGVAALEEGIVEPYERVMAHAAITIQNIYNPGITYVFHDWKEHGLITMPEAIAQSSNVFFYTIGGGHDGIEGLGAPRIKSYLSRFGFGSLLGVDLPGEEKDTIPSPEWKEAEKGEMWYIGDTYNMAIGQGNLSVTPLHLAAGLSAIANGGTLYKPQLVESILSQDRKSEEEVKPVAIQTAISSSENIQVVREGMRRAVTSGTARGLGSVPVAVAAKTGTAQSGGEKNPHSWISSFAPYENPEIALVVLIEEGGEGSGGALSVAQDVLSWYFGQAR